MSKKIHIGTIKPDQVKSRKHGGRLVQVQRVRKKYHRPTAKKSDKS